MIVTGVNPDDVWTYLGRTNLTAAQRARISLLIDEALFLMVTHDVNARAMSAKVKGFVQAQSWFQDLTQVTVQP